jgi:YggT family protein
VHIIPMPFFLLIDAILQLYTFIVFAMVIMSWLLGFNVINRHNQVVDMIWRTLIAMTEPFARRIRNILPSMGGLDLSPLILLLAVFFLREMNQWVALRIGIP